MSISHEIPTQDEIIAAMHQTKLRLAESMGFDVRRTLDDARQQQNQSGRPVVSFLKRTTVTRTKQGAA